MTFSLRTFILCLIPVLALGAFLGYKYSPKSSSTNTAQQSNNIVTVIRTVKQKDGSTERTKTVTDKSEHKSTIVLAPVKAMSSYMVQVGALSGPDFALQKPTYSITVSKRIVGPIWAGVVADTSKRVGAMIALEF